MSYDIFLDDERPWKDDGYTVVCRTVYDFINLIKERGLPNRVWFDHDMGSGQPTGADAAKWLVEYCIEHKLPLPHVGVHSQNPCGRDNIKAILRSSYKVILDLINKNNVPDNS